MSEKRKLTPFLAHEMLFDFATGKLDTERENAIEKFVSEDAESRNLLEAIRGGISYAQSLQSIELTEDTLQELDQSENFVSLSKRLARWSEWPDSLRWSLIAIGISVCTAALVVAIPWRSIPMFRSGPSFDSSSIEMARVDSRKSRSDDAKIVADSSDENKENETGPLEGSGDEEFSDDAGGAIATLPMPAPTVRAAPTEAQVPPKPVIAVAATPLAVPASPGPSLAPSLAPSTPSSRSYVYRAFMTLAGLEDIAPKITQQMKELGAEKAGEVELGWRRGSGRYYHFTLPETNEQKLLESLRVYGPVRISKDPHPRVMPSGQVRFILWIESGT